MFDVVTLETPSLGDRSYIVTDGEKAVVIDPQRDIDRVLDEVAARRLEITHVAETHIHNDYVTGGLALARETGASYLVNGADRVSFGRTPVGDGTVVVAGSIRLRALATAGHTFTHLSYVVETEGRPRAVFTGGSLLYGSTGRTDLLGAEHAEELLHEQFRSAGRLAALPDSVAVFPTHGFGSFCAATPASGRASTIGREKRTNPALTLAEDAYIAQVLAGLDVHPSYYAHMAPVNLAGPAGPDLSPPRVADAAAIARHIRDGDWVVDLRSRTAFAAGHVAGTLSLEHDNAFATYLGWLIPWGTPVTVLGETTEQVAYAQREMVRIGIDRPAGAATGGPQAWSGGRRLRSFPVASFADLAEARRTGRDLVVLDVRRRREWEESHVDGAVNIPIHELANRLGAVPDQEVWVHCRTGHRSSIAASLLDAAGRRVVLVDDDFDEAARADVFHIQSEPAPPPR